MGYIEGIEVVGSHEAKINRKEPQMAIYIFRGAKEVEKKNCRRQKFDFLKTMSTFNWNLPFQPFQLFGAKLIWRNGGLNITFKSIFY